MAITADQVKVGCTYYNTSVGSTVQRTIIEIIITKAGRFKFIYHEKWIKLSTKEQKINESVKTYGAVKGNYMLFDGQL